MVRLRYIGSSHISNPDKFFSLYRFSPRLVDPGFPDAAGAPPGVADPGVSDSRRMTSSLQGQAWHSRRTRENIQRCGEGVRGDAAVCNRYAHALACSSRAARTPTYSLVDNTIESAKPAALGESRKGVRRRAPIARRQPRTCSTSTTSSTTCSTSTASMKPAATSRSTTTGAAASATTPCRQKRRTGPSTTSGSPGSKMRE
jgi:hypothetical protein